MNPQERLESLGPAERIIETITRRIDHAVHNRTGVVFSDTTRPGGARWEAATWAKEGDQKVVYRLRGQGKKNVRVRLGVTHEDGTVFDGQGQAIAQLRKPGLFPEVVAYLYAQIAEVWRIDNEFAAKWASHAFANESNRDLKMLLAAFLLVQTRYGEAIKDGVSVLRDVDYRAVGEAMCLTRVKQKGATFGPKMLLRIGRVLELPQVAELNRSLGFGQSARAAPMGRYRDMVTKWLAHYEANPKLLAKLVNEQGYRRFIMRLANKVGYKPATDKFYEILRWKQKQSAAGHRTMAIGKGVAAAESWDGLTEEQICERITANRPGWKRIVGMLPVEPGLTPAVITAAVEAGCLSDADLVILSPTLEELGLLTTADPEQPVFKRWTEACTQAENRRAANIAKNVQSQEVKDTLEEAADAAAQKAVAEVANDFRFYVIVDKSGSMERALERAIDCVAKLVAAVPPERVHVCVFNTEGREIPITTPSSAGVALAFRGHTAGGGTDYAEGTRQLVIRHKPSAEEDAIFFYIGDQLDNAGGPRGLARTIRDHGVVPVAFGLLHVDCAPPPPGYSYMGTPNTVRLAAAELGIPCFEFAEETFEDPYALPRTLRNLIAATPVRQHSAGRPAPAAPRITLAQQILDTALLERPVWA